MTAPRSVLLDAAERGGAAGLSFGGWSAIAGSLIVVLGLKLWLIDSHAGPTPYWDQWDAEAAGLYVPWREGRLTFAHLIVPHVDHRILLTRLLALGLLELQGWWDTLLQMVVDAALHVTAIGVLLGLAARGLGSGAVLVLACFAALVFGTPLGSENTLWGFQSQFYFLILFSLLALRGLLPSRPFGSAWWLGLAAAVAAFFGMASGGVVLLAVLAVAAVQIAIGQRSGAREWAALAVYVALFGGSYALTPHIPGNDALRATSVADLVAGLLVAGAWPMQPRYAPAVLLAGAAVLVHLPMVWLIVRLLRERPPPGDPRWWLVGVWTLVAVQALAMVYGRAAVFPAPRYLDVLSLALVADVAALLLLLGGAPAARRRLVAAAAAGWVLLVAVGIGRHVGEFTLIELAVRKETGRVQTDLVRRYLATGDRSLLHGQPPLHVPYPQPDRLAEVLAMPGLRAVLPPFLLGQEDGPRPTGLSGFVARQKASLLKRGPLIAFAGVGVLLAVGVAGIGRRP